MKYRPRTITDDVLEAVARGIDSKIIRYLGIMHQRVAYAEWGNYGEWDYKALDEIAKELQLKGDVPQHELLDACLLCIRYRLTGHRKEKIRVA